MNETTNRSRSRIKLFLLALIGFGPLFVAYLQSFFYFPHLLPSTTTNNGELIDPPILLDEVDDSEKLVGRWSLILLETECGNECDQLGYLATQVVKGLGKDSSRVSKVLLESDHASSFKQSRDAFYDFQSLKLTNTEALSQISKGRSGLF